MSNETKSRKKFEEYMISSGYSHGPFFRNLIGNYSHPRVAFAWEVWQAALSCKEDEGKWFQVYLADDINKEVMLTKARSASHAALFFCQQDTANLDLENNEGQRTAAYLCSGVPFKVAVHRPADGSLKHFRCVNTLDIKTEVREWVDDE